MAWDLQMAAGTTSNNVLFQLGTQPGCQAYFLTLQGSNQVYVTTLGLVQ